jgi:hypothetical protein
MKNILIAALVALTISAGQPAEAKGIFRKVLGAPFWVDANEKRRSKTVKHDQAVGFIQQMVRSQDMNPIVRVLLGPNDFPDIRSYNGGKEWELRNPKPSADMLRQIADALEAF